MSPALAAALVAAAASAGCAANPSAPAMPLATAAELAPTSRLPESDPTPGPLWRSRLRIGPQPAEGARAAYGWPDRLGGGPWPGRSPR